VRLRVAAGSLWPRGGDVEGWACLTEQAWHPARQRGWLRRRVGPGDPPYALAFDPHRPSAALGAPLPASRERGWRSACLTGQAWHPASLREWRVVEQLKDILSRFIETSGLSRRTAESRLLEVWRQALGEQSRHTALESLRKNVASFRVDNASLLSELNNFRKLELLSLLQSEVREVFIRDIKFRPGHVEKG